ncbi:MAG: hypothetical protein HQ592_04675 [Planctomycetes bacterium]|nr:hypothetical protein [Planctomycetota bacterium]
MIPMQGPGFPSLGIGILATGILATSFFLALAWSFFYLAATSLLKPPSWNRSTSLRIWFVAFMLTSLGFFSYALTAVMPTVTDRAIIVYLAGFVGIPSVFAAIGFCGEPWELSSRMKDKLKKIPYLLRISFGPGSIAGGVFVRAMCLLTGAAALRTPAKMQEMVLWIFLGIFVYVNFCCSLAATVRALWDTPKSRLITVLILAGLCLFPCVGFLEHSSRSWFANIIYLNPFAALAESRGTGFADLHYGGIIFFGFHIVCAAVLFAVRRVYMMAQRPAAVIAQGPDRPAAASPGPAGAPPL